MFFPIPPSLFRSGPSKHWLVSIPLNCSVTHGAWWGLLVGLPWIPPPHARALPGSTNFVGTSAQAHLLVMNLNASIVDYVWEGNWLLLFMKEKNYLRVLKIKIVHEVLASGFKISLYFSRSLLSIKNPRGPTHMF